MLINKTTTIYFSPTNSTQKLLGMITKNFSNVQEINLTPFEQPELPELTENELLLVGFPVYSGRVPSVFLKRLDNLRGHNTPLVIVATYGNRAYDDALLEAKNTLEKQGFKTIAAAAFICEHSIIHEIASGRPNERDLKIIDRFIDHLKRKIAAIKNPADEPDLVVAGATPYCEYKAVPLTPGATDQCTRCGACARGCPVHAIPLYDPSKIEKRLCIACMRCIKICPLDARKLPALALKLASQPLIAQCSEPKRPEIFI